MKTIGWVGLAVVNALCQIPLSYSSVVTTQVHEILSPENSTELYRVLSTHDGRVYDVSPLHPEVISQLNRIHQNAGVARLVIMDDQITAVSEAPTSEATNYHDPYSEYSSEPAYEPTVFQTDEQVTELFSSLRKDLKIKSQCFWRAHVWAYDLWTTRSVRSMKVFIFFTRRYMREFGHKWWFHVAPFVYQKSDEIVLDPTFMKSAAKMREWTDNFMKNKVECPTVARYDDYSLHQEESYCYLRKVPMYYFQPLDFEMADKTGQYITDWYPESLKIKNKALR